MSSNDLVLGILQIRFILNIKKRRRNSGVDEVLKENKVLTGCCFRFPSFEIRLDLLQLILC